jgi:hypothetical protein
MMTRDDVLAEGFRLEDDMVVSPGKFESEHWTTIALWRMCQDGFADDTLYDGDRPMSVYNIDRGMREAFPGVFADDTAYLIMWEDDNGFVRSRETSQAEYPDVIGMLADPDDDPDDPGANEPTEDDLTTHDHERYYLNGRLVLEREHKRSNPDPSDRWFIHNHNHTRVEVLGQFATCEKAIAAYCEKTNYYPSVWFISDHGNAHLMRID